MRLSPLHIAITFFALAAALLVAIVTHKSKPAAVIVDRSVVVEEERFAEYLDEAEKQNALERDKREEAEKIEKIAKSRKESVECQFWKQQQKHKQDKRVQEKIAQFCELPAKEAPSSSQADQITAK